MLVLPQKVKIKWSHNNRNWYIEKGYIYTNISDIFEVDVRDLMVGCDIKVELICDNCNSKFKRTNYEFIKKRNYHHDETDYCKQCGSSVRQCSDFNEIKLIFKENNCILLTKQNEYKNQLTILKFICSCGSYAEQTLKQFKMGFTRCKSCTKELKSESRREYTLEEVNQIFKRDNYVLLTTDFKNSNQKLDYFCPEGHYNSMTLSKFLNGRRCPDCNNLQKKERYRHPYEYVKQLFTERGCTLISTSYEKMNSPLVYLCRCGETAETTLNNFLKISGCPACSVKSKGEESISKVLKENNIKFKRQYGFNDCRNINKLLYDFAIFKNGKLVYLIEYDGEQHFFPVNFSSNGKKWAEENFIKTQKHDEIKNKYCKENNIKLLRIPYYEIHNVPEIITATITNKLINNESLSSKWDSLFL